MPCPHAIGKTLQPSIPMVTFGKRQWTEGANFPVFLYALAYFKK